ncbi:MAG: magnesium transporter [Gammaproteobacteria bacterium]|nr:magnesium transporter [Gammaproteobacteria bacterium]
MTDTSPQDRTEARLHSLSNALESGAFLPVRRMLNTLHAAEVAHLLESMPPKERHVLWGLLREERHGDILQYLGEEVRAAFLREMDPQALAAATEGLDVDDIVDILQDLPGAVIHEVLQSMDEQDRQRVAKALSYDEDTAGGLMNTDTLTVRADVTLDVVLRYLRLRGEIPEMTDNLIVVDRQDNYLGVLPLSDLITRDPDLSVGEVMNTEVKAMPAELTASEVAARFERMDLVSSPVVDASGRLIGRITVDDVVDVIRDEAEHSLLGMAGLAEDEDTFAPILPSARRRAVWLGINLLTAFAAAWVIGLFEKTIAQMVALAVLMPIVASMGGIAGSQTLTLAIRAIALGQLVESNVRWLVFKELAVVALNSLLWAAVVAAVAVWWFGDPRLGWLIAAAIIINLVIAALSGVLLPLAMRRMGIDPALAGSVVLTTVTDVVGFFAFLGLATLFLL